MAATAEAKVEVPVVVSLDAGRFFQAEFKRTVHVLNLAVPYNYQDLFNPDVWKSIARKGNVGIGDLIEVRKDDMSLWAQLLVTESIANHARIKVVELLKKEFEPAKQDASEDDQFEIKHLGLQDGWAVFNRSSQRCIMKNLKSKDAARDYINTSLRPHLVGR